MKNPIIIANRIKLKREALEPVVSELDGLTEQRDQLLVAADEADTEETLDEIQETAEKLAEQIKEKQEEKSKLEEEITNLENQLEEINNKTDKKEADTEKGERTMKQTAEIREMKQDINRYVHTKGQYRDFTSVEGGALIPEELLKPEVREKDVLDLSRYVKTVKVTSGAGKYPVIMHSNNKMNPVTELAKNPKLANPDITDISYDIETYRGYIPVSQEVIDDADYDVAGLIADEIQNQALNTKNHAIVQAMKGATKKTVTGTDGIKGLINLDIKQIYNTKFFMSASMYNAIDLLKDNDGRYLLKDDITVESGKRLFGREVVVIDDDVIGTKAGDMVAFVGDLQRAITLFDRKQASVKWADHDIYGQLLAGFLRFDVQPTDTDAGYYVTFKSSATA